MTTTTQPTGASAASRPAKKAKRPALMLHLTDEEDRGKPDTSSNLAKRPSQEAYETSNTLVDDLEVEESKISGSSNMAQNKHAAYAAAQAARMTPNSNGN